MIVSLIHNRLGACFNAQNSFIICKLIKNHHPLVCKVNVPYHPEVTFPIDIGSSSNYDSFPSYFLFSQIIFQCRRITCPNFDSTTTLDILHSISLLSVTHLRLLHLSSDNKTDASLLSGLNNVSMLSCVLLSIKSSTILIVFVNCRVIGSLAISPMEVIGG